MNRDSQDFSNIRAYLCSIYRSRTFRGVAGALLLAPIVVLGASTESLPFPSFQPNTAIKSAEVNANFSYLDGLVTTLDAALGDLEAAITVDASNNVGVNNTVPSASLDVEGNLSVKLSGTVTAAKGSATVIGVGTKFTTELKVGYAIKVGSEVFTVASIANDTSLTLDSAHVAGAASVSGYTDGTLLAVRNGDGAGKLVVDRSGNVGIGTASPGANLDVSSSGTEQARFIGTSTGGASLRLNATGTNGGSWRFLATASGNGEGAGKLLFKDSSGTSLMSLVNSNGNVGIGTTNPTQRLHVVGNVSADDYLTNSDLRLKTDILPLEHAADGIACLQGVTYRWSDPSSPQEAQIGLIAQDVERCFPEIVTTDPDGYKSVSYARLVAPLIENAKEQQRALAEQQQALMAQQREITRLKAEQAATHARFARIEALLNAKNLNAKK